MAEGGLPPEVDLHLLECPICLERLRQPKSLPCLHSFCQDCLGTYITKEVSGKMASGTSFPCPVCRGMATPVNQAETKENWAQQFPTNVVIQELIKLKWSSEPMYCTPCQTKGKTSNRARFWCRNTESAFCKTCKVNYHDIVHIKCDILDFISHNRPKDNPAVPHCEQHNKKMVWYCEDHKLLGCSMCVFKDHRRCEAVTTTTDYIKKLTSESQLTDMQAALKKGVEVMNSLVNDFNEQLQDFVQDQELAFQSIIDLRQRINQQLDELQKNCTEKLTTLFKEEKSKLDDSLRQCERLKNSMLNTLKSSSKATEENDITETIVLYQRGQTELESFMTLVHEMNESFTSVNVTHQTEPELETFDDDTMGDIVIEITPRRFPDSHGYLASTMSERRVREVQQFNIKTTSDEDDCDAAGVVYLPYNQIVVSDQKNRKLKLFTDKGQYLDELIIQGTLWNLCFVDDNTVAVAVCNPGGVQVVKVENSNISLSTFICMPEDEDCCDVTFIKGNYIVCTDTEEADEFTVYSMTQNGTAQLLESYVSHCYCLSHDPANEDILVSFKTEGGVVLSRLSTDNHCSDMMRVGLAESATGLNVDGEGNIYLCSRDSNNVVQMSRDRTHIRELLTSSDEIESPFAIDVCGDMFVLAEDESNYLRLFQLY